MSDPTDPADPTYTLTIVFTADDDTLAQQAAMGAIAGTKDACPDDAVASSSLVSAAGTAVPIPAA